MMITETADQSYVATVLIVLLASGGVKFTNGDDYDRGGGLRPHGTMYRPFNNPARQDYRSKSGAV